MEAEKQTPPLQVLAQLVGKLTDPQQFASIHSALLLLPNEDQKEMPSMLEGEMQAESLPYANSAENTLPLPSKTEEKQLPPSAEPLHSQQLSLQAQAAQQVQLPQEAPAPQQPKREPLNEPPLIAGRRNPTEQSSQKSRTNQQESRKGRRRSSEEESVNLELTQKTKRSKNLSFTQNKVDSLLYSDATLLYSNDTNGFDREASNHLPLRTESHKVVLKQVDDEAEEISAHMERAESRECERMPTESQKNSQRQRGEQGQRLETQAEEGSIFQTQINDYKGKISKIRELKESKKRKLQAELQRVNKQLEELTKREQLAADSAARPNNFESRVKISDNVEAKVRAQRLVRELKQDKRSRQEMQLGELQVIDKNINSYMEELMRERYKNEERIKQRKKLEIIDRMKQQEMRKIEEQRQKDKNLQFVHQLRTSNSKPDLQQDRQPRRNNNSRPDSEEQQQVQRRSINHPLPHQPPAPDPKNKERSPTKKSEPAFEEQETPELSRKKAYLKKIRNLSFRKEKADAYEQLLN